jgi:hypothetical protein
MDPERIFLGSLFPLYEVEEDFDRDIEKEASLRYDLSNIVNSVGTDDFKDSYLLSIDSIKDSPIDIQQVFCNELLEKVREIYDYEFPFKLDFNESTVLDFYKFMEFVEFDYLDFLSKLWRIMNQDLRSLDIVDFCRSSSFEIVKEVDDVVETTSFPKLVSTFLRTYTKDNLVEFIIKKTVKDRMLIVLEIKEGEEKNG